jgi:small-conductance mechanosensitive channel
MKEQLIYSLIILAVTFIIWKLINIIYNKIFNTQKQIHLKFIKNFIQAAIIIVGLYSIGMQFEAFQKFSETLLMSSSLLVVVLGFAFQTSLEDFIAGILISIFKPFNIDDRITLTGMNVSGYIENITIRHTVIRTFQNSRLIIPNSKMNKEVIENTHIVNPQQSGFLDVSITYDSDLDLAKNIIYKLVTSHPEVVDIRTEEEILNKEPQITVFVRELSERGISLRTSVTTSSIDTNFKTCSEIREQLVKEFRKNNINFAYPHVTVNGKINEFIK